MKLHHLYVMVFLILCSCKRDADIRPDILGNWHIYGATRNNKVTKTLNGGIFSFTSDSTFTTNVFGGLSEHKYDVRDGVIITRSAPVLRFSIHKNELDTLHLSGKIRQFRMQFYLVKDHDTTH